jgi:hypothetical protein
MTCAAAALRVALWTDSKRLYLHIIVHMYLAST